MSINMPLIIILLNHRICIFFYLIIIIENTNTIGKEKKVQF